MINENCATKSSKESQLNTVLKCPRNLPVNQEAGLDILNGKLLVIERTGLFARQLTFNNLRSLNVRLHNNLNYFADCKMLSTCAER